MTADYIYTHDYTYDFLVCFFLPEIYDPFFRQDYAAEIEEDERLAYSRYIAALLPYEKDYDQIIQYLYDKEGAIAASSFLLVTTGRIILKKSKDRNNQCSNRYQ